MIVDFHTHCFPDDLAARAIPRLAEKSSIRAYLDGTVSSLRASMAAAGIDRSVMLQIAVKPTQNHTVNTWAIERTEPGIIPFGSVHPRSADWEPELERLAAAGIRGIKLHPEYQDFFVDDPVAVPIYRACARLGLCIVFHAGRDPGFRCEAHCTPQRILRVLDDLPRGRTILAHMGGLGLWNDVETLLAGTDLLFDTSFCYEHLPPDDLLRLIRAHGADKILLGSDSPWESQSQALETIDRIPLTAAERTAILGGNAMRLLGLD